MLYVPNPQGRCHYTGDNDPRGRARDRQSWRRKSGPPQISESRALRHLATKIGTPRFWIWTRSEEHTSELQSLMRISYAVFCLKKKIKTLYNTEIELKKKSKQQILSQHQQ